MLAAKLFLPPQANERGAARLPLGVAATMRDMTHVPVSVVVRDLSVTGLRLDCGRRLKVGQRIRIGISGVGVLGATVVHHDGGYGCTFDRTLSPHQVLAAEAADTVVAFGMAPVRQVMLEPDITRYPRRARAALLLGASLAGWWLILTLLK